MFSVPLKYEMFCILLLCNIFKSKLSLPYKVLFLFAMSVVLGNWSRTFFSGFLQWFFKYQLYCALNYAIFLRVNYHCNINVMYFNLCLRFTWLVCQLCEWLRTFHFQADINVSKIRQVKCP